MAKKFAFAILVIFSHIAYRALSSVATVGEEVPVKKRTDLDLKTCIDNFAVHKDKIIRTQDSRAMGAKYLNEIDLDTREECLRLCCETDNCDVFVYEEKNAGSCYLFQCGPPEDFKCKFTHHVNYSSGVLTVNRHLPDLESQIKLTKHEEDLSKLRQPEVNTQIVSEAHITTSTISAAATVARKEMPEIVPKAKTPGETKCSRFQFECRSNSECIAIYNACDGIPQCSDGSDEAPEVGCPDALTTSSVPIAKPNPQIIETHLQHEPQQLHQDVYRVTNQRQSLQVQSPPRQEDLPPPISDSRNPPNPANPYELQPIPPSSYRQYPLGPQQNWMSRQSGMSQLPQYQDKNSRIFNHKEVGLQVPDTGSETSQSQPYSDMGNREYPKVPNYYADIYRQPIPQLPDVWPNNPDYRTNPYVPEINPNPRDSWRANLPIPPQRPSGESNLQIISAREDFPLPSKGLLQTAPQSGFKTVPEQNSAEQNPTHVQNKMAHELKEHSREENAARAVVSAAAAATAIEMPPESPWSKVETMELTAGKVELKEGVAETPGGAILSLTLGLIITCLMAILIGCRLRVVKRRMRRGGKAYAHDADYLVNGMYL